MDAVKLPADYAIDALALETDRRRKALDRPYSYGQLIADTTPEQREQMAENYRNQMERAGKQGHHRVKGLVLMPEENQQEAEASVCQKMSAMSDEERAGE